MRKFIFEWHDDPYDAITNDMELKPYRVDELILDVESDEEALAVYSEKVRKEYHDAGFIIKPAINVKAKEIDIGDYQIIFMKS